MLDLIKNITGAASKVDDFTESGEERQKALSERHVTDMNSDSWFSKSIRPLVTLWTGLIWGITTIVMLWKFFKEGFASEDWTTIVAFYGLTSTPFTTCIAWYFESRKREKLAAQNSKANVKLKELETKERIRQERQEAKEEKRRLRRERNNN